MKFCDHQSNNVPRIHKIKRSFFIKIGLGKIVELNIILTAHFGQALNSDEERRFMYKINQGHLTVFCIVFV